MMLRIYHFLRWTVIFTRELVKANWDVVKLAMSPTLNIKPGFLTVPIEAHSDFEITSLANSITLTPGTISVHVSDDRKHIVIHAIHIGQDPDAVRASIKDALEANILKWTRHPGEIGSSGRSGGAEKPSDTTGQGAAI